MADCCDDFTRSHLLRGSVAKAGAGLPVIEPGMPIPAGTGLTRRSVLLRSAGLALAVYGAGKTLTPQAFEAAVAEAAGEHKVLVSIFMDGGADALSLLAPVNDARYVALRPTLRMLPGAGPAFAADPRLHVAPLRAGAARAVGRRRRRRRRRAGDRLRLARTSRTSRRATSGRSAPRTPTATTGWLGRYLDRVGSPNVPIQGLEPRQQPLAAARDRRRSPSPRRRTSATTSSGRAASGARCRRGCARPTASSAP